MHPSVLRDELYGAPPINVARELWWPTPEEVERRCLDDLRAMLSQLQPGDAVTITRHDQRRQRDHRLFTLQYDLDAGRPGSTPRRTIPAWQAATRLPHESTLVHLLVHTGDGIHAKFVDRLTPVRVVDRTPEGEPIVTFT